jgi:hypothetical protein
VSPAAIAEERVTRDDLESKFRELRGEVDSTASSARQFAIIGGAVAAVGALAVVYFLGKRRAKRTTTLVEVRRL